MKDTRITRQRIVKSKFIKSYGVRYKFFPKDYRNVISLIDSWIDINYMSLYEDGRMDVYYPHEREGLLPLVIWIHGGGYTGGDKIRSSIYCKMIASTGFVVINMNYHLAPDAKYPTPIIQFYEMINYLRGHLDDYPVDISKIFIGGDSAGAQIASQIGAIETNDELASIMNITPKLGDSLCGLLLCCGLYDMNTIVETKFPLIDVYLKWYTGESKFLEYERINELSTIKNITKRYPRCFITCGKKDYFFGQNKELCEKLTENNIEFEFIPSNGRHEYHYNLRFKGAKIILNKMIEFMKKPD